MATSVQVFNKTGERFFNEGEYADPSGFTAASGSVYSSQENSNKIYKFPSDTDQQHFFERKPLDSGTVKILTNNIDHLIYQKCRTLCVTVGHGTVGYKKSDLDIIDAGTGDHVIFTPFPRVVSTGINQFREIGWSEYSSQRFGPFFGITDRKVQLDASTADGVQIENNASCIRKMILVVSGYKRKIDVGHPDAEGVFRLHVVVTSDGGSPLNPNASIIPLCAEERGWVEGFTTTPIDQPIPASPNTAARALERQGWPAYTVDLQQVLSSDWYGRFKIFIPINCIGNINQSNASPAGVNLFQYFVHLGWYVGHEDSAIGAVSLLEVRDPGTSLVS